MTTRAQWRRDLNWPVPAADLQDLDVIEIVHGEDGQVLWRVDDRPAAAPQDCREALMKRRHLAEPTDLAVTPDTELAPDAVTPVASGDWPDVLASSTQADESSEIPELAELPVLAELPEIPELAALTALTDMPDMPLVLQATELPDADMALQLRENTNLVDVQAPAFQAAAEDALPSPYELPELPEWAAVLALTDMPDVPLVLQPTELLDVPTSGLLRENAERVDVPAVPQVETAEDTLPAARLPEFPALSELPERPEWAAVLALTDMPDVPLALQATELLDVPTSVPLRENAERLDVPAVPQVEAADDARPAVDLPELPEWAAVLALTDMPDVPLALQATELLDVPTSVPLRENAERLDVPVVPQVETAEDARPAAELSELPALSKLPERPEWAAVLALTDMPDVPLALQETELLDVPTSVPLRENAERLDVPAVPQFEAADDARPAADLPELPEWAAVLALTDMPDVPLVLQPTEFLDVPTSVPLRENAERVDVPAVPQVEAAVDALPAAELPELPALPELPELPELAALSALTEMPDLPSLPELPQLAALAALTPPVAQASDFLDMATALQLREGLEFLDVPVLHVFHAHPEIHALLAARVLPEPHDLPQVAALRRVVELPEAREVVLAREWPQAAEFVDVLDVPDLPQAVEPSAIPEPAVDAPEVMVLDEPHAVTVPLRRPAALAADVRAWVVAVRAALAQSRVESAERLALVGGGMLMGVLFAIVGGPRGPVTANVAATGSTPVHLTSRAPAEAGATGAVTVPQPMVQAGRLVKASVPPFPITIPAETFPGMGMPVTPSTPRPRQQAAPAVLGAIQRYAVAYNRQDARATKAVWPSADRQALVKTFTGLREQRLTLLSCTTAVTGNSATASCLGTRRYRPRVGDSSTRIQQGRWRFGLQRTAGTWLIASVDAPNG